MKMSLQHNGDTIVLDECEQTEVYEFYRLHSMMDQINDYITEEKQLSDKFITSEGLEILAKEALRLMDEEYSSEYKAIETAVSNTALSASCYHPRIAGNVGIIGNGCSIAWIMQRMYRKDSHL